MIVRVEITLPLPSASCEKIFRGGMLPGLTALRGAILVAQFRSWHSCPISSELTLFTHSYANMLPQEVIP